MSFGEDKDTQKRNEIAKHVGDFDFKKKIVKSDESINERIEINHEAMMDQMLKAIDVTPMEEGLKAILRIRITQSNAGLILMKMAQKYSVRFNRLLEMEEEAKQRVLAYIKKTSLDDIVKDFNQNSRKERDLKQKLNDLGNPDNQAPGKGSKNDN